MDIPDWTDADDYAKPELIPTIQDISAVDKAHKTIADIEREFITQTEKALKEKEEKQTAAAERSAPVITSDKGDIEIEQIVSAEEIIYGSGKNDTAPFLDDDIDVGQIDITDEASPEETDYPESTLRGDIASQSEINQTFEYFAKQLIKKSDSPKSSANLSMDSGTSISVSEENIHGKIGQSEPQNAPNSEKDKGVSESIASESKDNALSANGEKGVDDSKSSNGVSRTAPVNRLDVINSGAQFRLSDKIGIENKHLCMIEHPRPECEPKKEGEGDMENETQLEDIFRPHCKLLLEC